mmetsp:Transcript_8258/g.23761  ORF Transcript_8258/g.23761 Transcript_8258/m.23761 type:complete len:249 (-) Transcript_8258:178-924(-)
MICREDLGGDEIQVIAKGEPGRCNPKSLRPIDGGAFQSISINYPSYAVYLVVVQRFNHILRIAGQVHKFGLVLVRILKRFRCVRECPILPTLEAGHALQQLTGGTVQACQLDRGGASRSPICRVAVPYLRCQTVDLLRCHQSVERTIDADLVTRRLSPEPLPPQLIPFLPTSAILPALLHRQLLGLDISTFQFGLLGLCQLLLQLPLPFELVGLFPSPLLLQLILRELGLISILPRFPLSAACGRIRS